MNLTQDQIRECMSCVPRLAIKYTQVLNDTMVKYHIDTPLRQAHFLAQVGHESLGLVYTAEIASGLAYENRADLGNTEVGDGVRFKGRGFIELTGRSNYRMYGQDVGVDLEAEPKLLQKIPLCADSAGWFWSEHDLNDYADKDNILIITRRINGGTNGIDDRKKRLIRCKSVLSIVQSPHL